MEPFLGQRVFPADASSTHGQAPANPPGFHPLFNVVGLPPEAFSQAADAAPAAAACENPQLEVQQLDGRVMKIFVTCKCGEKIEINCEY